jgi:hypothetical protein
LWSVQRKVSIGFTETNKIDSADNDLEIDSVWRDSDNIFDGDDVFVRAEMAKKLDLTQNALTNRGVKFRDNELN